MTEPSARVRPYIQVDGGQKRGYIADDTRDWLSYALEPPERVMSRVKLVEVGEMTAEQRAQDYRCPSNLTQFLVGS